MEDFKINGNNGAHFGAGKVDRFVLWRIWDNDLPKIMFIGLNPSTANADKDDPTIRRVKSFAQGFGFGGVYMLNLFPFVTAYPEFLVSKGIDHDRNDEFLKALANQSKDIVFAWGNFKVAQYQAKRVAKMFPNALCLGHNRNGSPKHPLYVPGNVDLIKYEAL